MLNATKHPRNATSGFSSNAMTTSSATAEAAIAAKGFQDKVGTAGMASDQPEMNQKSPGAECRCSGAVNCKLFSYFAWLP